MYVRAVSRHDGMRSSSEHSLLRDWLLHASRRAAAQAREPSTSASARCRSRGLAGASGPAGDRGGGRERRQSLALQQRDAREAERAAEEAKKQAETRGARSVRCFRSRSTSSSTRRAGGARASGDRARAGAAARRVRRLRRAHRSREAQDVERRSIRRTVTVPDFWNDQLALSSLILARDVRALKAAFAAPQQVEHPYAFGRSEVVPRAGARLHDRAMR